MQIDDFEQGAVTSASLFPARRYYHCADSANRWLLIRASLAGDEVFFPGTETAVGGTAGPGAVAVAFGEQVEREHAREVAMVDGDVAACSPRAGPARQRSHGPRRRLYAMRGCSMSSPALSSSVGASTHAVAEMLRSRVGVGGRSSVCTGVSSKGRWSAGRARLRRLGDSTAGRAHQPRSIHSSSFGRSAPMVVSSPCPGSTMVSAGSVNSRRSIEPMMVSKSPP